ncbi:MAG TPA: DegT/DnrJ/EryC1/StrS family aminotransferase, partial [bacterium]|nr:DegT/DnrJ/EryC1/StrS family aminotransferase [bacterium]
VSTVNLITLLGARPVFADIDRGTMMITPAGVEPLITEKTRAIVPVHYAGAPADLDGFRALARNHGVHLIEDAAHALGTRFGNELIGSRGTAVFSFHPIKNITTAEGGMVVGDDEELIEKIRVLKFHGLGKDAWQRYSRRGSNQVEVVVPGFKYNMTDLQASLGLTQLPRLEGFNRRREELANRYDRLLADVEEIILPSAPRYPHVHSHHLYIVFLDTDKAGIGRDDFLTRLKERNIGTGIHFRAAHTQQYYREHGFGPGLLPETEWVSERLFSLPFFPEMLDSDVDDAVEAIKDALAEARRP